MGRLSWSIPFFDFVAHPREDIASLSAGRPRPVMLNVPMAFASNDIAQARQAKPRSHAPFPLLFFLFAVKVKP